MSLRVALPAGGFEPRSYQEEYFSFYDNGGRRGMWVWHRRAGKDLVASHQEAKSSFKRPGAYWHFFPTLEQGRRALWEAFLKDGRRTLDTVFPGFLDPRRAGSVVRAKDDHQMKLTLVNGAIWRVMGTDKLESVGAGPVGVTFSEFSLCRPTAWDYIRPMLRENGGWASFIFTPRGRNHAWKMYEKAKSRPGWKTDFKNVKQTNLEYESEETELDGTPKLLDWQAMVEEEKQSGMLEELVRQEYHCDFNAAMVGSYYGDLISEMDERGAVWDFDHPTTEVFVACDIGITDSFSMWAFRCNDQGGIDFLAHYEAAGKVVAHYVNKMIEWEQKLGFHYVKVILPHDARAKDVKTGISTIEQFATLCNEHGWKREMITIAPHHYVQDGIEAVRWVLQLPTRFHKRCETHDGVEALRQYHRKYDEDKRSFSAEPDHDWTSHSADAARYAAVTVKKTMRLHKKLTKAKEPVKPLSVTLDKSMTLDQLFKSRERRLRSTTGRIS